MGRFKTARFRIPYIFELEYSFEISNEDKKAAWDLYCELSTRVGVIEFIEGQDLIINCLTSWFTFFGIAREKLKTLFPTEDRSKEKKSLAFLILALLNEHMRPFLQKWHPQFEHYWTKKSDSSINPIKRRKLRKLSSASNRGAGNA